MSSSDCTITLFLNYLLNTEQQAFTINSTENCTKKYCNRNKGVSRGNNWVSKHHP